jgi:hypothetical protein
METVQYSLQQGGKYAAPEHIQVLMDCAEICQTGENLVIRESSQFERIRSACADVCDSCAQDCEQFGNDRQMQACAQACRECAKACRQQAQMAA